MKSRRRIQETDKKENVEQSKIDCVFKNKWNKREEYKRSEVAK